MEIVANRNAKKETVVEYADIKRACDAMIVAMLCELPKEVHTIKVFDYVLQECIEVLKRKVVILH